MIVIIVILLIVVIIIVSVENIKEFNKKPLICVFSKLFL